MNKRKGIAVIVVPLLTLICLYIVFYPGIDCKPNHASFWFILALGMSIGVALTRIIQFSTEKSAK
jgi:hypothetical protein